MGRNQQIQALKIGNQMRSPAALGFFSNKAYRGPVCCGYPLLGLVAVTLTTPPLQRASLHQNSMLNAKCIEDEVYLPKAIQWNPKSNIIHNS